MPTNVDLAYIAGIFDADGTIGIKKSTYAMRVRKDSSAPVYSERVHIRQVTREAIDVIVDCFGGNVGKEDPYAKRGKTLFRWGCSDRKAVAFLTAIMPYLRIKKKQAENCIALRALKEASKTARVAIGRGHIGAAIRPEHLSSGMESLYTRAKELNRVGV